MYTLLLYLFIWLYWVFMAAHGLSLVMESGDYSLVAVHRLLIAVASLVVEHVLWSIQGSVVAAPGLYLEHRLNSCGTRA